MGKKSRDKGYRGEYNLVKKLAEVGISAIRVPLSGASKDFKNDLLIGKDKDPVEVKVRKDGFKQLYKWLDSAKYLFVKSDRKDYLVVMRLEEFAGLYISSKYTREILRALIELIGNDNILRALKESAKAEKLANVIAEYLNQQEGEEG